MIRYASPLRKLWVFARHEGVASAFRKARAKQLTRRLAAGSGVVVAHGRSVPDGNWCVGCGRQVSAKLARMLFRSELIFAAAGPDEAARAAGALAEALARDERLLPELASFDPHSSEPAPDLRGLRKLAGELRLVEDDTSRAGPARARPAAGPASHARRTAKRPLVLVGAGDYTYACVLPALRRHSPWAVVDYNPLRAQAYVERFGFTLAETDFARLLDRVASLEAPTVVIATYHSLHTPIAAAFLAANPRAAIFVEKPPAVGLAQIRELAALMDGSGFVEVGFNRRYAKMLRAARDLLHGNAAPLTLTCVVRELRLEPSHWYFWKSEGARVYGNWCHWIDVATWLAPAQPVEISLQPSAAADSVAVRFADGSLLQLVIGTAGDGFRGVQETIDIRAGDTTIFIDDFKRMTVLDRGRTRVQRAWVRDRGHTTMYREFEDAVLASGRPQYSSRDLLRTMTLTEQIRALLVSGERQRVLAPDTQGT
jgi:predicted dehydrogenase